MITVVTVRLVRFLLVPKPKPPAQLESLKLLVRSNHCHTQSRICVVVKFYHPYCNSGLITRKRNRCAGTDNHNNCVFYSFYKFTGRRHRVKMTKELKELINVVPLKFYFLIIPKV